MKPKTCKSHKSCSCKKYRGKTSAKGKSDIYNNYRLQKIHNCYKTYKKYKYKRYKKEKQEGSTQRVASLLPGRTCHLCVALYFHQLHSPYSISSGKNGQNYCSLQD